MDYNGKRYTEKFKKCIIELNLSGKAVVKLAEEYEYLRNQAK